ncbi:ABC transporter permease [Persicitalea jodogahamensis]|uniref:ABC transporter permease n=1 Tax=Persicitalea jodogahamensis TaxID=402147 RepID=A0A8J3D476_9BACT|nr:ABC transporter permease [Persicitalea jodogahamensis]GHB70432.1 ABC transporter permease [Persicitalea jodogahamensis]
MLKNYLTIAVRNLVRNRTYSFINIAGLSVGLATCVVIALYVLDDLSFDTNQPKADRIGLFQQFLNSSSSGSSFSDLLKKQTGIEAVTQVLPRRALVSRHNLAAYESRFCLADSSLTKIFDFPMAEGSLQDALALPSQVVISERMATKYFANTPPVGQTIDVQLQGKVTFTVAGVMRDTPENTHLPIDFLASSLNAKTLLNSENDSYWDFAGMTYFLLSPGASFDKIKSQLPAVAKQTNDPNAAAWSLDVIPLRDIYLRHRMDDRVRATNAIEFVRIFGAVALCILLLACFNYLNLSSARSTLRAREVGVRKAMGANRSQLIRQFMGESFLFTLIATGFALLLAHLALPFFNDFADKNLTLAPLFTSSKLILLLGFVALTSVLTGLYPAFVLSNFNPIRVLKNYLLPNSGRAYVRRGLVVVQFVISIVMLVATIVVMDQLRYIQHKDLGYEREQVLSLDPPSQASESQRSAFQNELRQLASVQDITQVSMLPGTGVSINKLSPQSVSGPQDDVAIGQLFVDSQFTLVFGVKMIEGRFFQKDNTADRSSYVVNETAMKKYGWKLGQTIGYVTYQYNAEGGYAEVPVNGQIIGVVEDFNQMDLKSEIMPMMLINNAWGPLALKLQGTDLAATVPLLKTVWKKQFPNYPFEYSFLDEAFDKTYRKEIQTSRVFGLFAGLSVFISCLGLLGLVAFTAEQRTKEIGVRKVLGASVASIVALLSRDFLKPILIALIVAAPIAWYGMDTWLQDFAYRIDVPIWSFVLAGSLAALVAFLTMSYQAIRAARVNPVKSLRSE